MEVIIKENFFYNFNNIKNEFKKIKRYKSREFNKKFNENQDWPGERSQDLFKNNPFLFNLIVKELYEKFNNILQNKRINLLCYTHLRLDKDNSKDFIHCDGKHDLSLLVYLSDTNLESGTALHGYLEQDPQTMAIGFVQNRALMFDSKIYHKSMLNYGSNTDHGRLTLNCFINFV